MVKTVHCKNLHVPGALLVACTWCMQPRFNVQAAPTCLVITGIQWHLMHAPQALLLVRTWCMQPQRTALAAPTSIWTDTAISPLTCTVMWLAGLQAPLRQLHWATDVLQNVGKGKWPVATCLPHVVHLMPPTSTPRYHRTFEWGAISSQQECPRPAPAPLPTQGVKEGKRVWHPLCILPLSVPSCA